MMIWPWGRAYAEGRSGPTSNRNSPGWTPRRWSAATSSAEAFSVSVTHVALGSIRVMVQCALTGEAAGAASALSLHDGVPPRLLNIPALQSHLRQQGGILNADDVQRVNAGKAWFWDDTVELARL